MVNANACVGIYVIGTCGVVRALLKARSCGEQGAYVVFHSGLHPTHGELRGDLMPSVYPGVPAKPLL